jgi:uncharacterized protein
MFLLGILVGGAALYLWHPQAQVPAGNALLSAQQVSQHAEETAQALPTPSRSVPIIAVDQSEENGVVGNLTVRMIPGTGNVLVNTNPFIEPDVQQSAMLATQFAQAEARNDLKQNDLVFTYQMPEQMQARVVGGGSAGAVTTIAAIALLENKSIRPEVAMTGTINADGSIGEVGAVAQKAHAAADAGYKIFLVPAGEMQVTYYERNTSRVQRGPLTIYRTRYIPKSVDLQEMAKDWGITIKEVATIKDAEQEMLE